MQLVKISNSLLCSTNNSAFSVIKIEAIVHKTSLIIVLISTLKSSQKLHSIESIISSKSILCLSTKSTKNFKSKYQAPNKFLVITDNTFSFIINNLKNKVSILKKITIKKTRWRLVLPCFYYFIF